MKIDIVLQAQGIRCLKGLSATFLKLFFNPQQATALYLIYFCSKRQLRFLIDSQENHAILAIDSKIILANNSSFKQSGDLLVIQFKQGYQFLQALCHLADMQGLGELTLNLSKERPPKGDDPFRSLNIVTKTDKFRSEIFRPLYDPPVIVHHPWLSGCASMQQKKVQFDIDTQHIMNLLRLPYRDREVQNQEKTITLGFQFLNDKYKIKMEKLNHFSEGMITLYKFGTSKYEGNYYYIIRPQNAGVLYELLLGKSSGSYIFINVQNQLVFSYFQEGVYESQVVINEWISFDRFEQKQEAVKVVKKQEAAKVVKKEEVVKKLVF